MDIFIRILFRLLLGHCLLLPAFGFAHHSAHCYKTSSSYFAAGIDLGQRHVRWGETTGRDHFASNYHQVSPYLLFNFKDWVGIKTGLLYTEAGQHLKRYGVREPILELSTSSVDGSNFYSSTRFRGGFIDAMGFLPTHLYFAHSFFHYVRPYLAVGFGILEKNMKHDDVSSSTVAAFHLARHRFPYHADFHVGIGMHIGSGKCCRFNVAFFRENHHDDKVFVGAPDSGPDYYRISLKNSYYGNMGILFLIY